MNEKKRLATTDYLIKHFNTERLLMAEKELAGIYGQRYLEYRRNWQEAGKFTYAPAFPLYLMLEQTYRCNMRCVSCIHGYPELRRKFGFKEAVMPWDLYERLVLEGEANGCPSISTHNNDEPLLVKDIEKRIAFAKEHGFMDVIMTTNGVAFTEGKLKAVIDAGVTRILFSIDALTKETYDKVRPGGDLDKVLWAMDWALRYRQEMKSHLPIIRASFVVNSLNQHELRPYIEKYSKIVDYIDVQPYYTWKGVNSGLIPRGSRQIPDFRCNGPWRMLTVRGNGDVLPCPNFYGVEMAVGNVYQSTLKEIFNSDLLQRMRNDFKAGNYKGYGACPECSGCSYEMDLADVMKK